MLSSAVVAASLVASVTTPAAVADVPGVGLTTEDGLTIHGTFHATDTQMPPAVVLVHDWGHDRTVWSEFAAELNARGIAAIAIDLRGHGESLSAGDLESLSDEDVSAFPNDVRAAIRFLREREDIDGVRVAVIGAGLGANVAAAYATDDHLLVGLGLLSPTLEDRGYEAADAIHAFGNRSSLVITAKGDRGSAESVAVIRSKAAGECEVLEVDGADHGSSLLSSFRVRAAIMSWLDGVFAAG